MTALRPTILVVLLWPLAAPAASDPCAEAQKQFDSGHYAAGRQALIRRFWSAGTPEEPSLQNELGLDADDWLVVGGLIEQIRQLQQEMAEALSKHHQALRALLAQPDTPAADLARELEAMRLTAARYRVQLAALRENLRQLLTLEQEARLIVAGVLE